jgi:hypothetical protein
VSEIINTTSKKRRRNFFFLSKFRTFEPLARSGCGGRDRSTGLAFFLLPSYCFDRPQQQQQQQQQHTTRPLVEQYFIASPLWRRHTCVCGDQRLCTGGGVITADAPSARVPVCELG